MLRSTRICRQKLPSRLTKAPSSLKHADPKNDSTDLANFTPEMRAKILEVRSRTKEADYELVEPDTTDYDTNTIVGDAEDRTRAVRNAMTLRQAKDGSQMATMDKYKNKMKLVDIVTGDESSQYNKWVRGIFYKIAGTMAGGLIAYLAYTNYKEFHSRALFEYYNCEFDGLKVVSKEFKEMVAEKVLLPLGFDPEQSRLRFKYVDQFNHYDAENENMIAVFHDKATNGLDIYIPHFYEKSVTLGYFLENSEHYCEFHGERVNTSLRDADMANEKELLEAVSNILPSDDEIVFNIAQAVVKKYGYDPTNTKSDILSADPTAVVPERDVFGKKVDKLEDSNGHPRANKGITDYGKIHIDHPYQKFTKPRVIKPFKYPWQHLDSGHKKTFTFSSVLAFSLYMSGRSFTQDKAGVTRTTFAKLRALVPLAIFVILSTQFLSYFNQISEMKTLTQVDRHLAKVSPEMAKGLYTSLEKWRRQVVDHYEKIPSLQRNYDAAGNPKIAGEFLHGQYLSVYHQYLHSTRLEKARELIEVDYGMELPEIKRSFADEDELSWI